MSVLHTASTIFVDFNNIIANTDLFVCKQLYQIAKDAESMKTHMLHAFFEIIDQVGEEYIINYVNTKKNHNPFREIVDSDMDDIKDKSSEEIDDLCQEIYDAILYYDYSIPESIIFEYTNIADALWTISKDKQLETVFIYVEDITPSIQQSLMERFENYDKFIMVTGDKGELLNDLKCDLYIFDDIMDIELLPSVINPPAGERPIDILFNDTIPNMELWKNYFVDDDGTHKSVSERVYADINIVSVITN